MLPSAYSTLYDLGSAMVCVITWLSHLECELVNLHAMVDAVDYSIGHTCYLSCSFSVALCLWLAHLQTVALRLVVFRWGFHCIVQLGIWDLHCSGWHHCQVTVSASFPSFQKELIAYANDPLWPRGMWWWYYMLEIEILWKTGKFLTCILRCIVTVDHFKNALLLK